MLICRKAIHNKKQNQISYNYSFCKCYSTNIAPKFSSSCLLIIALEKFQIQIRCFNLNDQQQLKKLKAMVKHLLSQFFSYNLFQIQQPVSTFIPAPLCYVYFNSNSEIQESTSPLANLFQQKMEGPSTLMVKQCSDSDLMRNKLTKQNQGLCQKYRKNDELGLNKFQQQYSPKSKAKKNGKLPLQNALRNILPNIIHQIFCFIQKEKRSGQVVRNFLVSQSICQEEKFNIGRFYRYQRLIKDKTNHYINMNGLKELNKFHEPNFEIYSKDQQLRFIHMNRILLKYFLEHQFESIILTSSRMKADTRILHLKLKRKILEQVTETLSGN